MVVREILFKAATRTKVTLTFIANQMLRVPPQPNITAVQVSSGFDVADNEIVRRAMQGDLVITSDIPLAAEVIEKGALALSPRGELLTADNVKGRLMMRDFMDTMRSSGVHSGGAATYSAADKQAFANQLDRYLARQR